METPYLFTVADRVGDRIVEVINEESNAMIASGQKEPEQLLAGLLLAFKTLEKTMPKDKPDSLSHLCEAINIVLLELIGAKEELAQ